MRYTSIQLNGQTFEMPSITLGSVFFGTSVPEKDAFAIMDAYYELGGTWLDTARVYCTALFPPEEQKPDFMDSEEVVGRWVAVRGLRDKVTVITKGAHWSLETHEKRVNPDDIRRDMETSLKKLNLEQIDLYFLHNDDPRVPVETIMPVLDELVRQGKTRAVGCSNWKIGRVREANAFATRNGLTPFSISQVKWSYAAPTPQAEAGSVDMEGDEAEYSGYRDLGMPLMAYSSQARGFFLKAAKGGFSPENLGSAAKFLSPQNQRRAEAMQRLAATEGISISAASFAYLWSREVPVTALVGPSTAAQLRDSMSGCDYRPTAEAKRMLEQA